VVSVGKPRVLVADDDVGFTDILTATLERMGCEVLAALDGEEALRLARREQPTLVVAAETLSKLGGFKLCRLLKFDRKRKGLPVIVMTVAETEEGQQIAEQVRANAYLAKTTNGQELANILQRALKP
jgi:DNA-binding response OmpR family regulator